MGPVLENPSCDASRLIGNGPHAGYDFPPGADGQAALQGRDGAQVTAGHSRTSRAAKKPSMPPRSRHRPGWVRRLPVGVRASGMAASSSGVNGSGRRPSGQVGNALRPFLGLQRADRVDQPSAGPQHRAAAASIRSCPAASSATSRGRRRRGTSGWRRMVPVALHGASSSTASSGAGGRHSRRVRLRHIDLQAEPGKVLVQPAHAGRVALDGENAGAGGGELRRLAAGRGAEIGDALAGPRGEQAGGQRRGGVLHPEAALRRNPAAPRTRVPGAKRTEPVGSSSPPGGGAAPGARVRSSGASCACASAMARASAPQLRPEPGGRVESRPVQPSSAAGPAFRDPAQHCVHQPGEASPAGAPGPARPRSRPPRAPACRAGAARPRRAAARGAPRRAARGSGTAPARRRASRAGAAPRRPADAPPPGRAARQRRRGPAHPPACACGPARR